VALFHGHLRKVRVMLKVDWVTEYVGIEERIDLLQRDVQIFI
jgi:hypothetical protein